MMERTFGCAWCKGSGWIVAKHKTLVGVYAFRCSCTAGNNYAKMIPVWSEKFRESFTPDVDSSGPIIAPARIQPKAEPVKFKTDFKARAANPNDEFDDVPF